MQTSRWGDLSRGSPPIGQAWWERSLGRCRANKDAIVLELFHGPMVVEVDLGTEGAQPAVRCYRCGKLLVRGQVIWSAEFPSCRACCAEKDERRRAGLDEQWNAEQERIRLQAMRDHPFEGEGSYCSRMQGSSRESVHGTITMAVGCGYRRENHPDE